MGSLEFVLLWALFNNWELDVVEAFFSRLLVKLVRREENDRVI